MASIQFRLGMFDSSKNAASNPSQDFATVGAPAHEKLAEEAALQSIVLLQNKQGLLPLDLDTISDKKQQHQNQFAVIGPHFNATSALLSNYHGAKCRCQEDGSIDKDFSCLETPLQAIAQKIKSRNNNDHDDSIALKYVKGCNIAGDDLDEIETATQVALDSDVVILFLGLDGSQESEGKDRYETTLPGLQMKLMNSVLKAAGPKTIIVLIHGGSLSLGDAALESAGAIISAGYGGQAGSSAIASVLFGDYNPTGKLAATWYPSSFVHELPLTEMGLRVGVGRTHMYYNGTPEFAFGHGLSYSSWQLDWVDQEEEDRHRGAVENPTALPSMAYSLQESGTLHIHVVIKNMKGPGHSTPGVAAGSKQTLLLFYRPRYETMAVPKRGSQMLQQKLIDFQETSKALKVGQSELLEFEVDWNDFAVWDPVANSWTVLYGMYDIIVSTANSQVSRMLELIPAVPSTSTVE